MIILKMIILKMMMTMMILDGDDDAVIYCLSFQEPKLSAARRIVAEWTDYDEEMSRLGELIKKGDTERREKRDEL